MGDAKEAIHALSGKLRESCYRSAYKNEITNAKDIWEKEMLRLAAYSFGEGFEPNIKALDHRTIPEFHELTGSELTQTAAICALRSCIGADDIIVTAGGSLPSCLQRMWTTDKRGGYHAEYGYSCMGYEVAGALGVKMAEPGCEVYAFVGDAGFQMMHGEIMTAMQEGMKINILVFDNCGFGCINNLQMSNGIGSLATEYRYRGADGQLNGALIPVDYAQVAKGYGLASYTVKSVAQLKEAVDDAKKQKVSVLIDLKVFPKTMTDGYESWWNVGMAAVSKKAEAQSAYERVIEGRKKARLY